MTKWVGLVAAAGIAISASAASSRSASNHVFGQCRDFVRDGISNGGRGASPAPVYIPMAHFLRRNQWIVFGNLQSQLLNY